MEATPTTGLSRKQAAIAAVVFGLLCLSFGFSFNTFLQNPRTTLNVFGTSCGGFAVFAMGMATVLQILKAR